MKNTEVQDNKFQKEIKRIKEAGNYEEVKYITIPDYPTDCLMAICRRGSHEYLVNYTGDTVKEVFKADELLPDLGSIPPATFRIGDKWGMVNSEGEIMIEPKYDSIKLDANLFIFLSNNGKEGFIAGLRIFEPKFDSVQIGEDDYIEVTLNGIKGYIDENDQFTTDKSEAYYNFMMYA